MDNDEFLNSFMNMDILAVEGVAEVVGRVAAKLRLGMMKGGMGPEESDILISSAFGVFLDHLTKLALQQGENK